MIALNNGFQEVVGIVADVESSAKRLRAAFGFTELHRGSVPAGALTLLGVPTDKTANEILIGHPDSERGAIRLISFEGALAPLMRDGAQAWDTGHIFDINIRALGAGIEPLHHALGDNGFVAHAPITDWDFGTLSVREVVESDSDGLTFALMERVSPPLNGYEGIGGLASWVFNSTQVVADFDAARSFYTEVLGWLVVQETTGNVSQTNGHNCMGLPIALATQIPMRIGIYQQNGRMEGSIEIIELGCGGHDFSQSTPPQRGWASVRLPVDDVIAFADRMRRATFKVTEIVEFMWDPYGMVRAVTVITPWGARIEALQLL